MVHDKRCCILLKSQKVLIFLNFGNKNKKKKKKKKKTGNLLEQLSRECFEHSITRMVDSHFGKPLEAENITLQPKCIYQ